MQCSTVSRVISHRGTEDTENSKGKERGAEELHIPLQLRSTSRSLVTLFLGMTRLRRRPTDGFLSPLPGLAPYTVSNPRLTPWARILRPFGAMERAIKLLYTNRENGLEACWKTTQARSFWGAGGDEKSASGRFTAKAGPSLRFPRHRSGQAGWHAIGDCL